MQSYKKIPFYSSEEIINFCSKIDCPELIREAYINHYSPDNPPKKFKIDQKNSPDIVLMPYIGNDGLSINKVMFIEKEHKIPGIFGWMILYDIHNQSPIAVFDATALTGVRTAAKSLLVSQLLFVTKEPRQIYIYGSSTQASHHYFLFSKYYTKSMFTFIVRSDEAKQRIEKIIAGKKDNCNIFFEKNNIIENPDIIITATKSGVPIISKDNFCKAQLLIAVGSSSGNQSEIGLELVELSQLIIDSHVSISGKGEIKLAIDKGIISKNQVNELYDLLTERKKIYLNKKSPILFVSKGLSIEDYMFARKIAGPYRGI